MQEPAYAAKELEISGDLYYIRDFLSSLKTKQASQDQFVQLNSVLFNI
jgi:hypothetical protein